MKLSDDAALALLHTLLRVCEDSAEGYAIAERDVVDPDWARQFAQFGHQRRKLAEEIQHRITNLRGDARAKPTLTGAVHRAWMDYRAGADANPLRALLAEIERGEDFAVDAYRQALKERDIDATTLQLIQRQYESVQAAHDRIKQLRDRTDYAAR
jgi:uncharacterized protein (TIGR02284 family)